MAVSGSALAALIQTKVDTRMSSVGGHSPLAQADPSYFIAFCEALGKGIIQGGPSISFTTNDTGSKGIPAVTGTGVGMGIVPDATFFIEDAYTRIRGYILADLGSSMHDSYPPGAGNSGEYLLALCQGLNDAFQEYYPTAWTLASTHPAIYAGSGSIVNGHYSGLSDSAIKGAIVSAGSTMQGSFWPKLAQAIAESYVKLIHEHSTGQVTIAGVCVPGSSQDCGINGSGTGSGAAT